MSERPKNGADPDATVMLPAGGGAPAPDPDATVMMPPSRADDDATVMMPARRPDDDATVMMPARRPDDDATVMMPASKPDDDATVMLPAARGDEDATVRIPAAKADDDATVVMPARAEPDAESTVRIPTPGRRSDAEAPALPSAPPPGSEAAAADMRALGGVNALVAAANPVLAVAAQIRHALKHPDPDGLRESLGAQVGAFEDAARAAGATDETVSAASLALCALVDESAASTPWGGNWASRGLLAARHGGMDSAQGAEAFFRLLEEKSADAAAHRELLEFFYACLALGYEGRDRASPEDREALAERRGRLLEAVRAHRPARDGELSAQWRGVHMPARQPRGALGLWAAAASAALLLAALYAGFSVTLGGLSDPVARDLAQLRAAPMPERPRAAPSPRIAEQLTTEISRGEVAVADGPGASTIVIRSDHLFASGSARLEAGLEPVVLRVAEALDRVPGTIVVTGHTDDVPIRTARFPSNWELSTERAASVVKLMSGRLKDASRLRAEGLADSTPAAPNDSAANRARNRRVEIQLRSAP
jgi:type VI secretion system protein ImpK